MCLDLPTQSCQLGMERSFIRREAKKFLIHNIEGLSGLLFRVAVPRNFKRRAMSVPHSFFLK